MRSLLHGAGLPNGVPGMDLTGGGAAEDSEAKAQEMAAEREALNERLVSPDERWRRRDTRPALYRIESVLTSDN